MAFLANYRCGTGADGAQTLILNLVVSPIPGQPTQVGGLGTITQAINPQLDVQTNISGVSHTLDGVTAAAMTGTFAGQQNFQGVLLLPNGWGQPGSATYWYLDNNGQRVAVGPVPATPIAAEQAA